MAGRPNPLYKRGELKGITSKAPPFVKGDTGGFEFFLVSRLCLGTPFSHGLCPNLLRLSLQEIRFQAEPGNEMKKQ